MDFLRRLFGWEPEQEPEIGHEAEEPSVPEPEKLPGKWLEAGWVSDVGRQRTTNEDSVLVVIANQEGDGALPSFGLFVLADGMGGHKDGEVVSALAVRTVARHILQHFYLASLYESEHNADQPSIKEVLEEGFNQANTSVASTVPGGGTTLLCALALGSQVYLANVGDSRAYLITPGEMEQVTRDHSLVDRLVEMGQLTAAEAAHHPQKNVLYRAVGQGGALEVDTFVRHVSPGHHVLLCSDGLWGMVDAEDVVRTVSEASTCQEACDALVDVANQAGGRDNISAVLIRFPIML
jgi:serine/threonine protein phosphatase PrpC